MVIHAFIQFLLLGREVSMKRDKELKIVYEFYWYNELENYTIAISLYLDRIKSRTVVGKLLIVKTQNLWMYK